MKRRKRLSRRMRKLAVAIYTVAFYAAVEVGERRYPGYKEALFQEWLRRKQR